MSHFISFSALAVDSAMIDLFLISLSLFPRPMIPLASREFIQLLKKQPQISICITLLRIWRKLETVEESREIGGAMTQISVKYFQSTEWGRKLVKVYMSLFVLLCNDLYSLKQAYRSFIRSGWGTAVN